jgi:hypothetical protein
LGRITLLGNLVGAILALLTVLLALVIEGLSESDAARPGSLYVRWDERHHA